MAVFQTMGMATKDRIEVRGFDLCDELIGQVGLTEGRRVRTPSAGTP